MQSLEQTRFSCRSTSFRFTEWRSFVASALHPPRKIRFVKLKALLAHWSYSALLFCVCVCACTMFLLCRVCHPHTNTSLLPLVSPNVFSLLWLPLPAIYSWMAASFLNAPRALRPPSPKCTFLFSRAELIASGHPLCPWVQISSMEWLFGGGLCLFLAASENLKLRNTTCRTVSAVEPYSACLVSFWIFLGGSHTHLINSRFAELKGSGSSVTPAFLHALESSQRKQKLYYIKMRNDKKRQEPSH